MIEHRVRVNWQIGRAVRVCPVQTDNRDTADNRADEEVHRHMEWNDQGVEIVGRDVPVEGREGIDAESLLHAGDGSKGEVVGGDPGEPARDLLAWCG